MERALHFSEASPVGFNTDAEERLSHDSERERHHVGVQVANLADAPAFEHLFRRSGHHLGIARQPSRGESWSAQAALALPQGAAAGHQPVAEDSPELPPDEADLGEVAMLSDEDALD